MSEEIFPLKRIDVVNFLNSLDPKVKPKSDDYKNKYVGYLCFKLNIKEEDIPGEIYHDIYMIKSWYGKVCNWDMSRMIKKHEKFFDASAIKTDLKRPSSSQPSSNVCIFFN